jgi:hypothetical protein
MCGGPSPEQKAAAASQSALDQQLAQQFKTGSAVTNPFFSNLVTNPGQNPQLAQQYAQQKAGLAARDAGFGSALPSGFEAQQELDLGENYAQAQDNSMFQRQLTGAQGLNPLGAASAAQSGNTSIMQAPLQNNFWSNVVGGLISGAGNIPFAFAKKGGYVKKDEPVMAHKGEVILNKKQQKKYLKKKPNLPEVEHKSIYMPAYA